MGMLVAQPPQTQQYHIQDMPIILIHMGFDDCGNPIPVLGSESPKGGLAHERGAREFKNAGRLMKANIPAVLPGAWGTYDSVSWKNEPLEFVILGLEDKSLTRVADCCESKRTREKPAAALLNSVQGLSDEMVAFVKTRFDFYSPAREMELALRCYAEVAHEEGVSIRRMHEEANIVRFAGHMGNFSYEPRTRRITLHDFDSAVATEELPEKTIGLSRIRDIESALDGLFLSYIRLGIFEKLSSEVRNKHNPFTAFLQGYFENKPELQEQLASTGQVVLAFFERQSAPLARMSTLDQVLRHIGTCQIELTGLSFPHVMNLYAASRHSQKHSLPYSANEWSQKYDCFLRARMEVMIKTSEEYTRRFGSPAEVMRRRDQGLA